MMMVITREEVEKEIGEKAAIAHEERIDRMLLRELSGGDYLVDKLKELEERLEELESLVSDAR